jgi:23S rRNA pseudouridine1911/1915/1917 synthase
LANAISWRALVWHAVRRYVVFSLLPDATMTKTVTTPGGLLTFLFAAWPEVKKSKVRNWLKHQAVLVNGDPITQFNHALVAGDVITIRPGNFLTARSSLPGGMRIWFEDEHLIVIDKPSGLLSIATLAEEQRTAYFMLTAYLRGNNLKSRERVWIVHRLDKETSGLMVFAKTPEAKEKLQSGWDQVEKHYEAIVEGNLAEPKGVFECHLDERNPFKVLVTSASEFTRHAVTRYRVLTQNSRISVVHLELETGRRHQLRAQLAAAGCPIIGDEKYGAKTNAAGRLGLHSTFLSFPHPQTGVEMQFSSPMPKDLAAHALRDLNAKRNTFSD